MQCGCCYAPECNISLARQAGNYSIDKSWNVSEILELLKELQKEIKKGSGFMKEFKEFISRVNAVMRRKNNHIHFLEQI